MASRRQSLAKPRSLAFANQNGRCFYCGQSMCQDSLDEFARKHHLTAKQARWLQCTGEHLVPHKSGGEASSSNIVAACFFCNHMRHARKKELSPEEFRLLVTKRMDRGAWHPSRIARR